MVEQELLSPRILELSDTIKEAITHIDALLDCSLATPKYKLSVLLSDTLNAVNSIHASFDPNFQEEDIEYGRIFLNFTEISESVVSELNTSTSDDFKCYMREFFIPALQEYCDYVSENTIDVVYLVEE